jgi:hypothetical protein
MKQQPELNSPESTSHPKERLAFATLENKQELKRVLEQMHSVHPNVILFTMTSAYNIAVALKAAWEVAYPDEEIPHFYSVNPHGRDDHSGEVSQHFNSKMSRLAEGQNLSDKVILVFDEYRGVPRRSIAYRRNSMPVYQPTGDLGRGHEC